MNDIVIPTATALLICQRAQSRWGPQVGAEPGGAATVVLVWSAAHGAPLGSFTIVWDTPAADEATITQLAYDRARGGSEDLVRQAINQLAGWPVASLGQLTRA